MDDMTDEETGSCGTSSSDELMEDDEMEGNVSKEDCLIIHGDNNDCPECIVGDVGAG